MNYEIKCANKHVLITMDQVVHTIHLSYLDAGYVSEGFRAPTMLKDQVLKAQDFQDFFGRTISTKRLVELLQDMFVPQREWRSKPGLS